MGFGGSSRCAIDVIDFWGRRVRCYQDCWDDHIALRHPEIVGHFWREALIRAVQAPETITKDPHSKRINSFYGNGPWWPDEPYLIKVVIEDRSLKRGTIKTAFSTIEIPPNETIVWRRE